LTFCCRWVNKQKVATSFEMTTANLYREIIDFQ